MMRYGRIAAWQHFVLIITCMLWSEICAGQRTNRMSAASKAYVTEVISVLQQKSVYRNQIDWHKFRHSVFYQARNSRTVEDTYPAITYAVRKLGDHHSYFISRVKTSGKDEEKTLPVFEDEQVPQDVGYIRIPFCMGNEVQVAQYIRTVTDKLSLQSKKVLKGWIVDLRDNFGGNMWPMMAALGSLLDTGTQGYFIDPDNRRSRWYYANGKAFINSALMAENNTLISLSGRGRIAVLINSKTASSGEAIAVLFKGYKHARLFGAPTFGVSTGCEPVVLSDGSRINLATTVFADRNQVRYGGPVSPDISCSDAEAVSKAIEWIRE